MRRLVNMACWGAFALGLVGCIPYERAKLDGDARFELLHRGQLVAFEQRLAAENQTGVDDTWTRVGEAWVALANCHEVDPYALLDDPAPDPLAELVHATLVLEDARRRWLIYHRGTGFVQTSISGTIHARLDDEDLFERSAEELQTDQIVWPESDEAWADELPGYKSQPLDCPKMYQALFEQARRERVGYEKQEKKWAKARKLEQVDLIESPPPRIRLQLDPTLDAPEEAPVVDTLAARELAFIEQAERVLELADALPEDVARLDSVVALVWRVRLALMNLAGDRARALARLPRRLRSEQEIMARWSVMRLDWGRPLAERELEGERAPDAILLNWRVVPLIEYALLAEREGRWEEAMSAYRRAEQIGVDPSNYWSARYGLLRLLARSARWEEVATFADDLPPTSSMYYPAYVWHATRGLRKTGQTDRLIALSLEAFRDRSYRADPFTRAIYVQLLGVLADYPFEERTVELLEDMGVRSKTFERIEEYAEVALDRAQPDNAAAAARWLLAKHFNAQHHPRYWAILALSAFLKDDIGEFKEHLARVVERPAQLDEAIGVSRRSTFFAVADAQLARVFRQMLPVMAEWGDGERAEKARQKWLAVIVTMAQEFVRDTPESLARPALIELYRIASTMLEAERARAYPERVGQNEPLPLVLGTVRVSDRDLDPFEPEIETRSSGVASVTLVPRDRVPRADWIEWFEPLQRDNPSPQPEAAR